MILVAGVILVVFEMSFIYIGEKVNEQLFDLLTELRSIFHHDVIKLL